ncbi:hypothetical protein PsYK624_102810 [Phanerochaete sordida]|uniref:Uncharacterized protein n=1 Tax=Phanerochaete sordida TaxID=48140 RepID=A0A9P3GDJ1_9APHY|nr:hypothetical protein PsYK624_102810 [Phanerochaete sordida]
MLVNTTVSNVSPALTYVPGALWKENTTSEDVDGQAKVYTYHHTNASEGEGRVHFTWFGSGSVWIFGGYRPVLGQYSVRLDGRDALKSPGYKTNDTVVDDAVLFTQSGLAPDVHRLELINTSKDQLRPILGFHRIVVQNDTPNTTDIDTKDSRCQWGPTRTGAKVWMNNGGISL